MSRNGLFSNPAHWVFLGCCLLTLIAYLPGLTGDYLFDDTVNILENRALDIKSLDFKEISKAAFSTKSGSLRRPVSMTSFALNRYFFGIEPFSYKLINLAIHLLTGLLLYWLTRQITDSYRRYRNRDFSPQLANWLPAIVCGLWLLHPLNLSSVLYIVQRMTSLSSLFMVGGLCLYLFGRRRILAGQHGLGWMLAGLLGCGALAIFSKEIGVLLLLYLLVVELSLFRFRDAQGRIDRTVTVFFAVCIALPLVSGLLYILANFDSFTNYAGRDFSLAERLLTEARVLTFYLKLIVAPSITQLGLYHDDIVISTGLLTPPSTLVSLAFLSGLLLTGIILLRRQPLISLGILWFFAGHTLESTIIPLEIAHEHRNYLPGYGIILALSIAISAARLPKLVPIVRYIFPVVLATALAASTLIRSSQWSDNINHAMYEARHHPESARAMFSAGRIHARLALKNHEPSIDAAYQYLERASQLDYTGIMPAVTMIKLSYLLDKPVPAGLFEVTRQRLADYPLSASDIRSLLELADCMGNTCAIPPDIFEGIFSAALKNNNTHLLSAYGFYTINTLGDLNSGLEIFEQVIELAPGNPDHWKNLINLLMVMTRFDEAQQRLEQYRALRLIGSSALDIEALQTDIDAGRSIMKARKNMAEQEIK